jgi:hypothetical protein
MVICENWSMNGEKLAVRLTRSVGAPPSARWARKPIVAPAAIVNGFIQRNTT